MNNPYCGQLFDLTGHCALVTGASGGLGRHFALTLSRAGAHVAVAARRVDKLQAVVAEIEQAGGRAVAVALDVADRSSVCAALDAASAALGTLDIVVNNAGVTETSRLLDYTDAQWNAVMDINLNGAFIVAQEAARRLVAAQRPGSIINITSILGNRVVPGVAPYATSKAALKHLTKVMALELARHGVRVNAIAPGYIATDLNRDFLEGDAGQRMRARIPSQRFGEQQHLEGALLLLASEAGVYITGTEIVVDGGHLCSGL